MKFGGNVLSQETGIADTLAAIEKQKKIWDHLVVVTSAQSGITDALHQIVQIAVAGERNAVRQDVASLREIHIQAATNALGNSPHLHTLLKELDTLFFNLLDDCDIIRQKAQIDPALADRIVAMGERFMTRIIAIAGRAQGLQCVALDADKLIITDDRHSHARPVTSLSLQRLNQNLIPLLEQGIIPIVTGYIGANEKGAVTTLGRGGSDYSATYLASLLMADEVWFFSDVAGLMSADPEIVPNARVLPTSSYRNVSEMARYGARLIHPHAIEPLIQASIPLRIRSLDDQEHTGTYIYSHQEPIKERIHAVTQAVGLQIIGPGRSNLTEVCNRLVSQHLHDDLQPSLQVDTHDGSLIVYIAPTSINQDTFYNTIEMLQNYDDSDEWDVTRVKVVAVIGNLTITDHIYIMQALEDANLAPSAFGYGAHGSLLIALRPADAIAALTSIHKLIQR